MKDRTFESVRRQAQAMGTKVFEIGLFKPMPDGLRRQPEMLPRTWDVNTLMKSISWLKFQNRDGRNIYIRPKGEHALTLIDDLTSDALQRMKDSGFSPAAIVETSPANFQVWLNHGKVLPKDLSSLAARTLASRFAGDPGSADWRHFGRLSGFTNRKEKHRLPNGLFPFVQIVHSSGKVYEKALEFLEDITKQWEVARREAERRRHYAFRSGAPERQAASKSIADFRLDSRYASDGNRIDLAYAVYALSHGVPEEQVRAAIGSRDLSHKGNEARQADYIDRTVRKAIRMIRGESLCR
jgi:hypothetical protein